MASSSGPINRISSGSICSHNVACPSSNLKHPDPRKPPGLPGKNYLQTRTAPHVFQREVARLAGEGTAGAYPDTV